MIIALVGLAAALIGLGFAGYYAAGALAIGFYRLGLPPQYGAAIANLLILLLVVVMVSASLLSVAERKWSALIQNRIGANRILVAGNPLGGIPYLIADAVKMLTKERFQPDQATKFLFNLAPVLAFAPIFALFAIIPVGQPLDLGQIFAVQGPVARVSIALQLANPDA